MSTKLFSYFMRFMRDQILRERKEKIIMKLANLENF